ncbi:MAG: hypothetical protein V1737_00615 [Chloroflexota bacterium]
MRSDLRNEMLSRQVGRTLCASVIVSFALLLIGLVFLFVSSPGGRMAAGAPLMDYPGMPLVFLNAGVVVLLFTPLVLLAAAARWFWPAEKRRALLCVAILGLFVVSFLLARS